MDTIVLNLDQGGYKSPSEETSFTPFYQNASQWVLAVQFYPHESGFVMKAKALLKLAREQRGANLVWEEWNAHAVEIQTRGCIILWVSSPRVFYICCTERGDGMNVYDFSPRRFVKCVEPVTNSRYGRFPRVGWPPSAEHCLPWHTPVTQFSDGGHDSIVLLMANVSRSPNPTEIRLKCCVIGVPGR